MRKRILVAGAAGVIGRRLTPLLLEAGYSVIGTTRTPERAQALRKQGVEPAVVDVLERDALARIVVVSNPDVIIHQVTDLPPIIDPTKAEEFAVRNAYVRAIGAKNLASAARAAGVPLMISQSIAWVYASGDQPHAETSPLELNAPEPRRTTVDGIVALEEATLNSKPVTGVVLRYGRFYGPGSGIASPVNSISVHVDAAAYAAMLAVEFKGTGIFNIVEPCGEITAQKAIQLLGWNAKFRLPH